MKIENLTKEFLQDTTNNSEINRTRITYENKINSFHNYLIDEFDITENNYINVLKSLNREAIVRSVEYYIINSNIRYASTTDNYYTVIKCFFQYISRQHSIINQAIDSANSLNILDAMVIDLQKRHNLNTTEKFFPMSTDNIDKLIALCNDKIDTLDFDLLLKLKRNSNYTDYISGLIIKLVILTGIKNNVILKIKATDYDCNKNTIIINGYKMHLPDTYSIQMLNYVNKVRPIILSNTNQSSHLNALFVNDDPSKDLSNSRMFNLVQDINETRSAQSIAKYAIMNLIQADIPSHTIMGLTGYAEVVYGHCLEMLREDLLDIKTQSRLLDSRIRAQAIFDRL